MMHLLALFLVTVLSLVSADETLFFKPLSNDTSLPEKMVLFIPGANVPNVNYTLIAESLQSYANMRLYVTVMAVTKRFCIIECPNSSLCSTLHGNAKKAIEGTKKTRIFW